jgi:hypothetical protein
MKWLAAAGVLIVLITIIPPAHAATRDTITRSDFLAPFQQPTERTCWYRNNNYLESNPAVWPSPTGNCDYLAGATYPFSAQHSIRLGTVQANRLGYQVKLERYYAFGLWSSLFHNFNTVAITNTEINTNTATQPLNIGGVSRQVVPLLTFGFCTEEVRAVYTAGNLAPSEVTFKADSDQCRRPFSQRAGGPDRDNYGFFSTRNTARHFTFPLAFGCTAYALEVTNVTHNDWFQQSPMIIPGQGGAYSWNRENRGNRLTVTLRETSNRLTSIDIHGFDGSVDSGGVVFSVYCVEPLDADMDQSLCRAPLAWHPSAPEGTPAYPALNWCCGDDSTDVDTVIDGHTCDRRQDNNFTWRPPAPPESSCAYPDGWIIPGVTNTTTDAQLTSYEPGKGAAYIQGGGCCATPTLDKVGTVRMNHVCIIHPDNRTRWVNASSEQVIIAAWVDLVTNVTNVSAVRAALTAYRHNLNITIASDGDEWYTCARPVTSLPSGDPQQVDANQPQTAPNCTTTPTCPTPAECESVCLTDCDCADCLPSECRPDSIEYQLCYDACINDCYTTSTCPSGTSCGSDSTCQCPTGQVWSGSSCVPQCPTGYTLDSGGQTCSAQSSEDIVTLETLPYCYLIQNNKVQNSQPQICHFGWTRYASTDYYYLNSSTQPVSASAPIEQKRYVCLNGVPANTTIKLSPMKDQSGIRPPDECYLPNVATVFTNTWVRNDYCLAGTRDSAGNLDEWETRTRFVAEALYKSFPDQGNFVLHCDTSAEAINNATLILPFEVNQQHVNGACAISRLSDASNVRIGVTLNQRAPNQPPVDSFGNLKPFTIVLNNSREFGNHTTNSPCNNTRESTEFELCAGPFTNSQGEVYYNNQYGSLIFAKGTLTPGTFSSFINSIRDWWSTRVSGRAELVMPFGGQKMYFAVNNAKSVQARLYYVGDGSPPVKTEAKIITTGITGTSSLCEQHRQSSSDRFRCDPQDGLYIVTITNPTQAEWERFTVRIRPQ